MALTIYPSDRYTFRLFDSEEVTLERLNRRTEQSENLRSRRTDKSLVGKIEGKSFRVISSETGRGALCIMSGEISGQGGQFSVEVNKPFKILFSIFYVFPIVALTGEYFKSPEAFPPVLILVGILQILMIRFFFVGLFYRSARKRSLIRLRDVLDMSAIAVVK